MEKIVFYKGFEFKNYLSKLNSYNLETVVSGYCVKENRICLIDHSNFKLWLPPGGHIKENENPIQAIERKFIEETGCKVETTPIEQMYSDQEFVLQIPKPKFVQIEIIREEGKEVHAHLNLAYFCRPIEKVLTSTHKQYKNKWFTMNELDNLKRLLPHTKINAMTAIRELGNIIPAQLKPQKGRVILPIGGRCSYKCIYCYTKHYDIYFGEIDSSKSYKLVQKAISESEETLTVQLGYDNEPFYDPEIGIDIISRLLFLPCHIGFSTKAYLDTDTVNKLSDLRTIKVKRGYNLTALVTLTSLERAKKLEPGAPSPHKRLQTIKNLASAKIPVMVNLRPILPEEVEFSELCKIMEMSKKAGAYGIVVGPFWYDLDGIVSQGVNTNFDNGDVKIIPWSPHGVNWRRYENTKVLKEIKKFCNKVGIPYYDSSADSVKDMNKMNMDCFKCG